MASGPVPRYLTGRRRDLHADDSPFSYANDRLREAVAGLIVEHADVSGQVLDLGCGERPYADLFGATRYIGADLPGNVNADIEIGPNNAVPLEDGVMATVLSTQVLEHVADPKSYLDECWRVLRTGGTLVLSTHGVMYYHRDPEDYWRWTLPGLRRQLELAGFEVIDARGVLGLAAAALQIFQDATVFRVPRRLERSYIGVMQRIIAFVDRRYDDELRLENCLTIVVAARCLVEREDGCQSESG